MSGPGYCGCCGDPTTAFCRNCQASVGSAECICRCEVRDYQPLTPQEVEMRVKASMRDLPGTSVAMGGAEWLRTQRRRDGGS